MIKITVYCDKCKNETNDHIRINLLENFDVPPTGIRHKAVDFCHNCHQAILPQLNDLFKHETYSLESYQKRLLFIESIK